MSHTNTFKMKIRLQNERKKLSESDIGNPFNFKNDYHVGWDANTGFDVEGDFGDDTDHTLHEILKKAGVSESHIQDENTRDFIFEFKENHGGIEDTSFDRVLHSDIKDPKILSPAPYDSDYWEVPALKAILEKAGVSAAQLQDENTRNFIFDFIQNHGGMDRVKEEAMLLSDSTDKIVYLMNTVDSTDI